LNPYASRRWNLKTESPTTLADSPEKNEGFADGDQPPAPLLRHSAAAFEPTDGELETAIVDAVRQGLGDVARVLAGQLEARQRARIPANVHAIDTARRRGRE
jgi:hypothetical protein